MILYRSALLQTVLALAITVGTFSCDSKKPEDSKDVAEENNDAKLENKSNEVDAQFLVNASEVNMEEISLGNLAQTKGSTSEVKELGKMMVDEHTKSSSELSKLAESKMVALPVTETDKVKEAYTKLNKKSGNDFDKAYSDMMVDGHKDAISLFEKASTECTDLDIKTWAVETLPVLRMHLDHSISCQKKVDQAH